MEIAHSPPSWLAHLDLRFAADGERCTRLVHNRHSGPLRVQRVLYPEGPSVAHALLLHPPGGIAGGDVLDLDIALDCDAEALITTPGAAKWYHGRRGGARQSVCLSLAESARLEWLPQETILFDGADAKQTVQIELAASARMIGWDITQFGRISAGESWQNGRWRQHLQIRRLGRECCCEFADLAAADRLFDSPLGLAGHPVSATAWAAAPELSGVAEALVENLRACAAGYATPCGISWLPAPTELLLVRVLGTSSELVRALLEALWQLLRPAVIGRAPQRPRIWDT
jgi:urease accessory protein